MISPRGPETARFRASSRTTLRVLTLRQSFFFLIVVECVILYQMSQCQGRLTEHFFSRVTFFLVATVFRTTYNNEKVKAGHEQKFACLSLPR